MGYGQNAFRRAIEMLATSSEPLNKRLADAFCREILPLSPDEIPRNPAVVENRRKTTATKSGHEWTELQDQFMDFYNRITDSGALATTALVEDLILSFTKEQALDLIIRLIGIYNRYIFDHPETRLITKAEAKTRLARLWQKLPGDQRNKQVMFSFWSELREDKSEVLNVRYRGVDPWHEVQCWLVEIEHQKK